MAIKGLERQQDDPLGGDTNMMDMVLQSKQLHLLYTCELVRHLHMTLHAGRRAYELIGLK